MIVPEDLKAGDLVVCHGSGKIAKFDMTKEQLEEVYNKFPRQYQILQRQLGGLNAKITC
ncbi:MAG: hypothetical protein V3U75_13085 [Methylococcaceae bacterium]